MGLFGLKYYMPVERKNKTVDFNKHVFYARPNGNNSILTELDLPTLPDKVP